MNCNDFAQVVIELAQSEAHESLDFRMKRRASEHVRQCASCRTRLEAEKSLSRGLRAVAYDDVNVNAPLNLESTLLAAFRNTYQKVDEHAPVNSWLGYFKLQWHLMKWIAVVTTALLIVAFALARVSDSPREQAPVANNQASFRTAPAPTASATIIKDENPVKRADEREVITERPPAVLVKQQKHVQNIPINNPEEDAPARQLAGRVTVDIGPFEIDESRPLSVKDFMVFDYVDNLPPADSSQLMRVRMAPTKLVPLGIRLPRELQNRDYINTDLLVGSDGIPRAIRVSNR